MCTTADGLGGILPLELLSIFTTGEVESIVCGVPTVDISILKKATDYDGVSPQDAHIQVCVGYSLLSWSQCGRIRHRPV